MIPLNTIFVLSEVDVDGGSTTLVTIPSSILLTV